MTDSFSEARARITGSSWLDDLSRASLSAAAAKFNGPPRPVAGPPVDLGDDTDGDNTP